jgi:cell division protease FtsH
VEGGSHLSQFYQKLALWLVFGLILVFMWSYFSRTGQPAQKISYSEFIQGIEKGEIRSVLIQGDKVTGQLHGRAERFMTYTLPNSNLDPLLQKYNVHTEVEPPEKNSYLMQFLLSWAPVLLLIGLWVFFMRQMQNGGSKALSFGKSRARLLSDQKTKATFADVAGVDEAKVELEEIIDFLKDPHFLASAARISSKCSLAWVPPGCGTCSSRAKNMRLVSFLSTRSMRWGAIAALVLAVAMTSASRR